MFLLQPERLQVVFKAAEFAHAGIQRVLACVTKRRMAKVVRKANRFGQGFIESQGDGYRPADLGNLERVRQSCPVQVAFMINEDLCLVHEAPKRRRMNNAIPVALVFTPIGCVRLIDTPAAAGRFVSCV